MENGWDLSFPPTCYNQKRSYPCSLLIGSWHRNCRAPLIVPCFTIMKNVFLQTWIKRKRDIYTWIFPEVDSWRIISYQRERLLTRYFFDTFFLYNFHKLFVLNIRRTKAISIQPLLLLPNFAPKAWFCTNVESPTKNSTTFLIFTYLVDSEH